MIALLLAAAPQVALSAADLADATVVVGRSAVLAWPAGTRLDPTSEGVELVVRSDRPLTPAAVRAFRDAAAPALGDLRWSDTTVVVAAAPGWTFGWQRSGTRIIVRFLLARDGGGPATDAEREAALALAEAELASGYPGRARRRAARLAASDPGDGQAARLLADAHADNGDAEAAAAVYRRVKAPDRIAHRTMAAAGGSASLAVTFRDGGDLSQVEAAGRVEAPVAPRLTAAAGVRVVTTRVDTAAGSSRSSTPVVDAALATTIGDGVRVSLLVSSAFDDGVTGGGARLTFGPREAQWRGGFTWRMPDFSTGAQALRGGYLSRGSVGGSWRITPALVAQADAGWNRYGVRGAAGGGGGGETLTLAGGADLLLRRRLPALGLSYRVEAEYVQAEERDAAGQPIVPLGDRENHTLQGVISDRLGEVQLTGVAGWTVDRFGGDGPTASLGAAAPLGVRWRIEGSGGVSSVARQGFDGRQMFARAQLSRSLGQAR